MNEIEFPNYAADEKLIDGVDDRFFPALKKYLGDFYYKGVLVEHLKMRDLTNDEYFQDFLHFIITETTDDGERTEHAPLFINLIFCRMIKKPGDMHLFTILLKMLNFRFNNSYEDQGRYELNRSINLFSFVAECRELFVFNILLFIKLSTVRQDFTLLRIFLGIINGLLVSEGFFIKTQSAQLKLKKGQLFLSPIWAATDNIKNKFMQYPSVPVTFVPPYNHTSWKELWEFEHQVWNEGREEKLTLSEDEWTELRKENSEFYN